MLCIIVMIILIVIQYSNIQINTDTSVKQLKYQACLNIFGSAMCFAILSNNIFNFFIGIEILSLISVILIGFEDKAKYETVKIFLMNKFSSILFLMATVTIIATLRTTDFLRIRIAYEHLEDYPALRIPGLLLLVSCLCKGAQFPFSSWLLDSTKANIFVSIFLHTATIVGFGVIFIAKCFFIFEDQPILQNIMVISGGTTAILMIISSLFHTDAKKIIACSTAASVGLMFIASGLGEYSISLLCFICHAFSKSVFFLSFAYVITALANETNIMKMGGLNKLTPNITDIVLISFLSTIGFPFFVSFFAKSSLLSILFDTMNTAIGFVVAFVNILSLVSFIRLIRIAVYGESRIDGGVLSRIGDIPTRHMSATLALVIVSIFGSFITWSMCEWDVLHFGNSGTVYLRGFIDYLIENLIEIAQIIIGFIVAQIIFEIKNIATQAQRKIGYKLSTIFTKHEVTAYILDYIANSARSCFAAIGRFDEKMSKRHGDIFYSVTNLASVGLTKIHRSAIHKQACMIFCGIVACLLYLLFAGNQYV
ncbi:MAG: hypothetical protein LBG13_00095 [Holosporales bacterium]|nr:hypothetical protein [Holosporales bacterium]